MTILLHFLRNLFNSKSKEPYSAERESDLLKKLLKRRVNYASNLCSARILSHNPEAQSASAILSPHPDTYMRNACKTRGKFVFIELCNEIKIDAIALANFELFSSTFAGFKVFGQKRSDDSTSFLLFEGQIQSARSLLHAEQIFPVPPSDIFVKYLRIEFSDEFHGDEQFCPLSVIKVYGKTMMEEFSEELHNKENLPIIPEHDLIISDESKIKSLLEEMALISQQLSQLARNSSEDSSFIGPKLCNPEDEAASKLKFRYAELEGQIYLIQQQKSAAAKPVGNVFKDLNDRLNKLENTLKHRPFNMILFPDNQHPSSNQSPHQSTHLLQQQLQQQQQQQQHLLPDSSGLNSMTMEDLFSTIGNELRSLKSNLQSLQSDQNTQRARFQLLLLFNAIILVVMIGVLGKGLLRRLRSSQNSSNHHGGYESNRLRRLPLSQLKSSNSFSRSKSSSGSSGSIENYTTANTSSSPGVLLSEDEVLLFEE